MIRYAEYNSTPPNKTPPLDTQFPPENAIRNRQMGGTPLPNASMNFPPTTADNSPMDRYSVPPTDSPTTARHHSSFENSNGGTVSILVDKKS